MTDEVTERSRKVEPGTGLRPHTQSQTTAGAAGTTGTDAVEVVACRTAELSAKTACDRKACSVDHWPKQHRKKKRNTRLLKPRAHANWSALLLLTLLPSVTQGQTPDPAPSESSAGPSLNAHQRLLVLEHRIDQLANSAGSHSREADVRFEALKHATDRSFQVFFVLGAVGSFLGALFVALAAWRDRRHHKDYKKERDFYEQRVLKVEQRQESFHDIASQISEERASNESAFAFQRLQLGAKAISQSDDIFSHQIDSISKLGSVIELVKQTFQKQAQREEELSTLMRDLETVQKQINAMTGYYEKNFESGCMGILLFQKHSRMHWTRLTREEQASASRARAQFESVPNSIVEAAIKKNPSKLARVHQLIGVSAYYSNDIDAATSLLERV